MVEMNFCLHFDFSRWKQGYINIFNIFCEPLISLNTLLSNYSCSLISSIYFTISIIFLNSFIFYCSQIFVKKFKSSYIIKTNIFIIDNSNVVRYSYITVLRIVFTLIFYFFVRFLRFIESSSQHININFYLLFNGNIKYIRKF